MSQAKSQTYRIAHLVKEYVSRMTAGTDIGNYLTAYVYDRSVTAIRIAVVDPTGMYEICYEVRVKRLGQRKRY